MLEINSIHPKINFTHERESVYSNNDAPIISYNPNILPVAYIVYLDIKTYRCDIEGFITCIYAKPFANIAPTHWKSCHPKHQKIGLISLIAYRISTLCSNEFLTKTFLGIHYNLFIQQGFPKSAVVPIFNNVLVKPTSNANLTSSKKTPLLVNNVIVRIPQNFLSTELKYAWNTIHDITDSKINVVPILNSNLITRFKSKPKSVDDHCCVYAISCVNCAHLNNNIPVISYVGQTSIPLTSRLHSHMLEPNSAVKKHSNTTGHLQLLITKLLSVSEVNVRVICEATIINILKPHWNVYDSSPLLLHAPILKTDDINFLNTHFTNLVVKHFNDMMPPLPSPNSTVSSTNVPPTTTSGPLHSATNLTNNVSSEPPTIRRSRRIAAFKNSGSTS